MWENEDLPAPVYDYVDGMDSFGDRVDFCCNTRYDYSATCRTVYPNTI